MRRVLEEESLHPSPPRICPNTTYAITRKRENMNDSLGTAATSPAPKRYRVRSFEREKDQQPHQLQNPNRYIQMYSRPYTNKSHAYYSNYRVLTHSFIHSLSYSMVVPSVHPPKIKTTLTTLAVCLPECTKQRHQNDRPQTQRRNGTDGQTSDPRYSHVAHSCAGTGSTVFRSVSTA